MKREEEIRARLAAEFRYWKSDTRDDITDVQAHGRFISNAPNDIDYLLKENQRLREALEKIASVKQCGSMKFHTSDAYIARQALTGDAE